MGTVQIANYKLAEQIYESDISLVYKTKKAAQAPQTILKVLKSGIPSDKELVRFHQEFKHTNQIDSPYVIKVWGIVQTPELAALAVEDFDGESLALTVKRNQLSLLESLDIAIDVVKGLRDIHQQHTIHRDVSPANIVCNLETGITKIIDFGNASSLNEQVTPVSVGRLEGNLKYMSPEQTGRMNRPVDYRTDFYSLGVTLYELFTGLPPFNVLSAHELIHCHIAKLPKAPCEVEPNIPYSLSEIVLKLMAKNADERYKSALGILADLEEVKRQLKATGTVKVFDIGTKDQYACFVIPAKLYGRDNEVVKLITAFKSVCKGSLELTLVTGYSGVGKTSLVQELYRPVASAGGHYICGKYDQYQRNIPYSALATAFSQYFDQMLAEPKEKLNDIKQSILKAVGASGQVLIEVVPLLENIIGPQPAVPPVDPQAAKNRFNQIFINFMATICQPSSPLIIFLDDLQWMDQASLTLFKLLLTNGDIKGLHLVGAYRDNEVDASHPLHLLLDDLVSTGRSFGTIHLTNLTKKNVSQLICQTLSLSGSECRELVNIVFEKTMGNAFFTKEFFKGLYAESLITEQNGRWLWDRGQIIQRNLTDNVVDYMAMKIAKYSNETKNAISMAACIGNEFDLETLRLITRTEASCTTLQHLDKALRDGILAPVNEAYKQVGIVDTDGVIIKFRFQHDRIQQAAYSLIPIDTLEQVHYRIGTILYDSSKNTPTFEEKLFEIVSHLNSGISCVDTAGLKLDIADLNYQAGIKALSSAAYQSATQYFHTASELLPKDAFTSNYNLALKIHMELARSLYINGEFEESEKQYPLLLTNVKNTIDEVEVRLIQMEDYHLQGHYERAIEIQCKGLSLLGEIIPSSYPVYEKQIVQELKATPKLLASRSSEQLYTAPEIKSNSTLTRLRLLVGMWMSAYLVSKDNIVQWCSIRMTNITLESGNSEFAAFAYVQYGYINVLRLNQAKSGYQFGDLAIRLADRYNNIEMRGKVYFNFAIFVNHWTRHISTSTELFRKAYLLSVEGGDWTYAVYGAANIISNLLIEGKPCKDIENEAKRYLDFLRGKADIGLESFFMTGGYGPLMNFVGKTEATHSFSCAQFNETSLLARLGDLPIVEAWLYSAKLRSLFYFRHIEQALSVVLKSDTVLEGVPAQIKVPEAYFYSCLIIAASHDTPEVQNSSKHYVSHFKRYAEQLSFWAKDCPQNFLHKHHLVEAEWSRVNGNALQSTLEHYNHAIEFADRDGYPNNAALALELKGRFWLGVGETDAGLQCLREAHRRYQGWGVAGKLAQLDEEFPELIKLQQMQDRHNASSVRTSALNSYKLDLETIYKASNAISSQVSWRDLIDTMLRIVMESTGADRGLLLIQHDDNWQAEAIAEINQQSEEFQIDFNKDHGQELLYPPSVVNYVANTRNSLHLEPSSLEEPFSSEPYFKGRCHFSTLCHFIPMKSRINTLLYLENTLVDGVFTSDRKLILETLLTQIGISLENARLYNEVEIKLADQMEKLKQSNLELEQFAYVASHDLQAPLRHVTAYVEMLQKEEPTPEQKDKWMGFIIKGASKMKLLIDDLLNYSRVTKQKSYTRVNLATALADVIDTFKPIITESEARVSSSTMPTIVAVDFAIRQVFQNLIGNALKFRRRDVSPEIIINSIEHSNCWEFTVQDNGIGMDPKYRDRIFQVFQRLHGSNEFEGTGIGLSICKKVVEFHKGAIQVESEVGKGTTFHFTIAKDLGETSKN